VTNGLAKIEDGTIAGSTLTMEAAVKNFMEFTGIPLAKAIRTATLNPARLLGMEEEIGSMKKGSRADLVLFDEDLKIVLTIVNGEVVFEE
jgi:N-acetylglucosamine-6-phosphate deacetylase